MGRTFTTENGPVAIHSESGKVRGFKSTDDKIVGATNAIRTG
jgi:hypothetical protein